MFYDDFTLGATFVSRGRTITESDIILFAGLSGDHSELHMNAESAKATPFGARIAHGALIFSVSIDRSSSEHCAIGESEATAVGPPASALAQTVDSVCHARP